jgi:coatomer protein complex subunit gamma
MSYGKKDEDADLGLVKVDRTQVFQEGESLRSESLPRTPPLQKQALWAELT